ncbi:outer membrane beta-barrel protein [Marinobacter sp. SS13-12]|uniref:outer membrane beta-barrel protein n=1 Tax=Marinobacter sp. SS13-12 TaxID=3050451 RepID=UPI002554AC9F|nr:outer membrane beta-barrel protein [Marinobacter sp. SS13-12]MDK8464249.1 outer membrane beta-barrel protein [Marinobacter sp. SS13-12]
MARLAGPRKCPEFFRFTVICAAVAATNVVQAEPLTLSGGLTSRFSDNVGRTSSNETSDTETRVDLSLTHQTDPGKCEARTAADVGYGVWRNDTFDPKNYVALDFAGDCEIARGLSWEVSDNLRDVTQNARASETPDNRTRKNVFQTGPVYSLMLGQLDQLTFSTKYQNTDFSEPEDTDSERYIGTASWNHIFSQTLSGGLQFSTNRAELDTGAEIDTDVASLFFSKSWQATSLSGSIGVSEIESRFGGNTQTNDGIVWNFSLDREINPVTQAYVRGSRELTDQTSDFDIRFGEVVFNLRETSAVEVTALDAGFVRQFSDASSIDVGVFANRSHYFRTDEVEDSVGFFINHSRTISTLLSLQTRARYQHRTFADDLNDDTYSADIGLVYELTQDLDISGRVGHTTRDSDSGISEYHENWASLSLDYRFF